MQFIQLHPIKLLFRKAGLSVLLVIVLGISLYILGMATVMDGEAAEKTQIILIRLAGLVVTI